MKCSRVELRNCRLQAVSHSVSVQSVSNGALLKNGGVKNKRSAFLAFCTFLRTLHLWADSSAFRHWAVYVSGRFRLLLASRHADVHTLTRAAFMTRKAIKRFLVFWLFRLHLAVFWLAKLLHLVVCWLTRLPLK